MGDANCSIVHTGTKHLSRRELLRASTLIVSSLALSACQLVPSLTPLQQPVVTQPVTLSLYYGPLFATAGGLTQESQILKLILRRYHQEHPNITIQPVEISFSLFGQGSSWLTATAPGHADVVLTGDVSFGTTPLSAAVVPLDSFIKQDKSVHVKDYYPVALAMWKVSGKQIALPRDIAPSNIIYYNRSLLQAAGGSDPPDGWSTSDFLKLLAKLHTAGQSYPPSDGRHWAYTDTSAVQGLLAFIYLFGGRLTGAPSQPNTVTIDRSQAVAGARFYVDLYRQGYAEAPLLRDQESQLADFLTGTIPLLLSDPSLIPTMQHVQHPLDWDITMLPLQQGVQQAWTGVGFSASLTKVCTQPDAAWDLIRYLIQGEGMKLRAGYGDVHPAYKPIANSSTYLTKLPPRGKRLFDTIGMQYMLPSLPVTADLSFFFRSPTVAGPIDYRSMGFSLNEDLTSVLQGNMSVSAALQDAARAAKTPAS